MSLNKRSLQKDARPEPTLAEKLASYEKHIKTRRGANRRAAFDALVTHDVERALAVVKELAAATAGKNQAELGGLLASTGIPHLVEAAARGAFGDVAVWQWAPPSATGALIDALPARLPTLSPSEIERRARALGLVPLEVPASPSVERALVALVDDERLRRAVRAAALEGLLLRAPWNVWTRRDAGLVAADVVACAGLATRYATPESFDIDAFERALAGHTADVRRARVRAAGLPKSAERFPPDVTTRLLALTLDNAGDDAVRVAAAQALAKLRTPDGDDALLARPVAHLPSTVAVCERLSHHEAHAVLAPLFRASEDARDAVLGSKLSFAPHFLDDAVAVLAEDPVAAMALLARLSATSDRARQEIKRALDAVDVDAAAVPLLAGLAARPLLPPSRAAAAQLTLADALTQLAHTTTTSRELRVQLLTSLRARAGRYTALVEAALRLADV